MTSRLELLVTLALTGSAAAAVAQPTSAHEEVAARAYDAGDLATALREFEAAFAETGRPDLLYAIGKLHAAHGDCPRAIDHFQRFLATGPGPKASDGARAEIATCEAALAAAVPAPEPAPVEPDPSPEAAPLAPAPTDGPGFYRDLLGTALVGGGVVAGVAAIVFYGQAIDAQCGGPVCTGVTYDQYLEDVERADRLRMRAIVVGGLGGALIAGGVVRYVLHGRSERTVDVAVAPTRGGGSFVVGGRF